MMMSHFGTPFNALLTNHSLNSSSSTVTRDAAASEGLVTPLDGFAVAEGGVVGLVTLLLGLVPLKLIFMQFWLFSMYLNELPNTLLHRPLPSL